MTQRISQLLYKIATKFQRYNTHFLGRTTRLDYCGDCPTCGFVRNQRWRPLTGSRNDITHISACMHYHNESPTTISMFSGSGNKTRLLRRLPDALICKESKMAHIDCQLTNAIFNSQLIYTSDSLRGALVV